MLFPKSKNAFSKANHFLVGGVNSPARAFKAVGDFPLFIEKALGSKIFDIEGNAFVDYVCSWGAIILGHSHPNLINAIKKTLLKGSSFGAPTLLETEMARLVIEANPRLEKVRMVNSGTEATLSAIRLARGYTGKSKIIKFNGCYHGHSDSFLIAAGSGALTLGQPDSPGVTKNTAKDTLIAEYNDFDSVEKYFKKYPRDIAAIIIEPVAGNMGLIPAKKSFLKKLREITKIHQSLLIFDEVMTGFRLALGGAASLYKINFDLACFGKVIGGGFPVGALAGKKKIMDFLAPVGPVYQAGTLSGNPIAMTAGIQVLQELIKNKDFYKDLESKGDYLEKNIQNLIKNYGLKVVLNRQGSMFTLFFTKVNEVIDFKTAQTTNTKTFATFFNELLKAGIYFPSSAFEAVFLNKAHTKKDLETTLTAIEKAFKKIQ